MSPSYAMVFFVAFGFIQITFPPHPKTSRHTERVASQSMPGMLRSSTASPENLGTVRAKIWRLLYSWPSVTVCDSITLNLDPWILGSAKLQPYSAQSFVSFKSASSSILTRNAMSLGGSSPPMPLKETSCNQPYGESEQKQTNLKIIVSFAQMIF